MSENLSYDWDAELLARRSRFEQNPLDADLFVNYALLAIRIPQSNKHYISLDELRSLAPEVNQMPNRTIANWYLSYGLEDLLPDTPGRRMMLLQKNGWLEISQEKFKAAQESFEASLEISFANLEAISGAAAAAWYLGQTDKYTSLHDLQNYVFVLDVRQFFDESGFVALNEAVRAACINPARSSGKIQGGRNQGVEFIEAFNDSSIEELAPLYDISKAALAKISDKLPDDPQNPFLARKAEEFLVYTKGAKLTDNKTLLSPHMHEGKNPMDGTGVPWMLAVYYPNDAGLEDDPHRAGWLQLGDVPLPSTVTRRPPTREICPMKGHLAFFPGHFRHGILPLSSARERFSINFDFVPKDEKPISETTSS